MSKESPQSRYLRELKPKTVNCNDCSNFSPDLFFDGVRLKKAICLVGKRVMFRTTDLPGLKPDPGYVRKCNDFKPKEDHK